jgi:ABC-type Fe3+/spermidine/putrescine transport system ATPase subunit
MLDEPLGALDRSLREQLSLELRGILHDTRIPAIYVTHDQEEAFSIADRLVLLHAGQVAQEGAPAEVYAAPASAWVARFFGMGSLLEGKVLKVAPFQVSTPIGIFQPRCQHGSQHSAGETVTLLVRPRPVEACLAGEEAPEVNRLDGVVEDAVFDGKEFRVGLQAADGTRVFFYLPAPIPPGKKVSIRLKPESLLCLGKTD